MPRSRIRLTPALQEQIVAFIRAGGYPHVAAEAAGLPREEFERWMRRGQGRNARPHYRAFARAVREAEAQARLNAQVQTAKQKPLDWLKTSPGKGSADNPSRTNPDKPRDASAAKADKEELQRLWCAVLDLFGRCAEQLAPYPEAHAVLTTWLKELPPEPPSQESRKMASDDTK
ncbi:MAG TPA: hypothetical protein VH575_31670 [Gemmataceae bacterium]|jgi:hypothetical protein